MRLIRSDNREALGRLRDSQSKKIPPTKNMRPRSPVALKDPDSLSISFCFPLSLNDSIKST